MSSPTPEPHTTPLIFRLPALALSLGIASFLVFQAGVPGCSSSAEDPTTQAPTSDAAPAEAPPSSAPAAPTDPPEAIEPAANAAPEPVPAGLGNAEDPTDAEDPTNTGNSGNKAANAPETPRFFPASKAMAPLIEPQLLAPADDSPPSQAQQAQQAPPKSAGGR